MAVITGMVRPRRRELATAATGLRSRVAAVAPGPPVVELMAAGVLVLVLRRWNVSNHGASDAEDHEATNAAIGPR